MYSAHITQAVAEQHRRDLLTDAANWRLAQLAATGGRRAKRNTAARGRRRFLREGRRGVSQAEAV